MKSKTRIYAVCYGPKETISGTGYDPKSRKEKLLDKLSKGCKDIELIGWEIISDFKELEKIEEREDIDGIFLYFLEDVSGEIPWFFKEEKLDAFSFKKHPLVFACDWLRFGGGTRFLEFCDLVKQENLPAIPVYSSNFNDIIRAIHLIDIIHRMKESKILNVGRSEDLWDHSYLWRWKSNEYLKTLNEAFGTQVITIGYEDLNRYYEEVNEEQARKLAKKWMDEAIAVEPGEDEIIKSARMYFAIKKAMENVGADAITIDCISLLLKSDKRLIPAYPCLAFAQLNDEGSTGVCEADMDGTVTQLVMRYLTGRPGFISDQTFDTFTNQMIYWHCIAPTKLFGKDNASVPYKIRITHTGEGAGHEVIAPSNEIATAVKLDVRDRKVAIHQGRCIGNSCFPGCRTQWVFKADAKNILNNYRHQMFGRHRVIVFGDFRNEILNLAKLLGFEVIEEDKR